MIASRITLFLSALTISVSASVAYGKLGRPSAECRALHDSSMSVMRGNAEGYAKTGHYFRSFLASRQGRAPELADKIDQLAPGFFSGEAAQGNKGGAIFEICSVFKELALEIHCTDFVCGGPISIIE